MTISGWRVAAAAALLATIQFAQDATALSPCVDIDRIETVTDATGCQLAALINAHQSDEFQGYFDLDGLAARIKRLTKTQMYQEERYATVLLLAASAGQFGESFSADLRDSGGYVVYLHGRRENRIERLLYRVDYGENGGMNYIEFKIRRRADGEPRIVDWYSHDLASWASQQFADLVNLVFIADGESHATLVGYEADDATEMLESLSRHFAERDLARAVALMETLPESVRHAKPVLRLRVYLATKLDEHEPYHRALAALAEHYGEEPELGLMLLDHYLELGDHGQAHASITRFDRVIEDRPVMDFLHAAVFLQEQDFERADTYATRATSGDRTLLSALAVQFDARVRGRNFPAAVESLESLRRDFNHIVLPEALADDELYKEFSESSPYQSWLERVSD